MLAFAQMSDIRHAEELVVVRAYPHHRHSIVQLLFI